MSEKIWQQHFENSMESHEWIMNEMLLKKRASFWNEVLQIHDTYGVPFDLIEISLKENKHLPEFWNTDDFKMFMLSVRHWMSYSN